MLLIINNPNILNVIDNIEEYAIFNISSLKEGYPKLDILPINNVQYEDERDFDMQYFNWIFSNDYIFKRFFSIINLLYMGHKVILLVSNSDEYNVSIYSLMKMIQQRYGYISTYINDVSDIQFIDNSNSEFSFHGLYNLDMDKERYIHLLVADGELQ